MALKYKVGDKVRIKSLDWYNENKDNNHEIKFENGTFTTLKSTFLGQIMTIEEITLEKQYILMEDRYKTLWTDEMIEGLVEDETKPEPKFNVGDIVYSRTWQRDVIIQEILPDGLYKVGDIQGLGWFKEHEDNLLKEKPNQPIDSHLLTKPFKQEISLPEGYQFVDESGNVINATKIVLEKKKKEYPKTYEECRQINDDGDKIPLKIIGIFTQLINARNAYWKIAGEEMGLGKPWEPDYKNPDIDLYVIINVYNKVEKAKYGYGFEHCTFSFPTPEMRDAFKGNFDKDLEICKELL